MSNINFKECSLVNVGTALPDCVAELGQPKGFVLTSRDWSEDVSTTLDKAYFQQKVQEGVFIPFLNATGFEENTPDATNQEFQDGTMVNVRSGKPMFTFQYTKSVHFQKIASKYNSFERFNILLVFDNDNLFGALNSDETEVSGLKLGMLHTNTYNQNDGSNVGQTPISMQLLDNKQYNEGAVIDPEFDLNSELFGILDVDVAGTSASGSVSFSVKASVNEAVNIKGLLAGNLRLVVDGVAEAITNVTYDDVSNEYTGDPTNAFSGGEEVVVELYDDSIPANVAILNNRFYRGKSTIITAVA